MSLRLKVDLGNVMLYRGNFNLDDRLGGCGDILKEA